MKTIYENLPHSSRRGFLTRGGVAMLPVLFLAASVLFAGAPAAPPEPKSADDEAPIVGELPPDIAAAFKELYAVESPSRLPNVMALRAQQAADERRITIRQANLLHRHFLNEIYEPFRSPRAVPGDITGGMQVDYGGVLRHSSESDLRIIGSSVDIGNPLEWMVCCNDKAIFQINVTTAKTKFALAKCTIEGQDFYANVIWVLDGKTVDDVVLGKESVRQILSRIEKPLRKVRNTKSI
jgi:hypothetical protein